MIALHERRVRANDLRCPYCHDGFEPSLELQRCDRCHAPQHAECVETHGSCASCGSLRALFVRRLAAIEPTSWCLYFTLVLMGIALVAWALALLVSRDMLEPSDWREFAIASLLRYLPFAGGFVVGVVTMQARWAWRVFATVVLVNGLWVPADQTYVLQALLLLAVVWFPWGRLVRARAKEALSAS